jgi:hypothetical protein
MLGFFPFAVRAMIFVLIALATARCYIWAIRLPLTDINRWFAAWFVLTIAAFLSGHFLIFSIVVAVCCYLLWRLDSNRAIANYVAILPLIPLNTYTIPGALGIDNIVTIDYARVLALVLLLPALLMVRRDKGSAINPIRNSIDVLFFGYCAWQLLLAFFQRPSLTDSFRTAFEVVFFLLVPYVAVSRLVCSRREMDRALTAFVYSGIIVVFIGLVEQSVTWYFYEYIPAQLSMTPPEAFAVAHETRFGFLRLRSSVEGGVGYFLVFALGGLIYARRREYVVGIRFWATAAAFLTAVLFTGSRGTWIVCALMIASTIAFPLFKTPVRFAGTAALGLLALPYIRDYFINTSDRFGTFDYRAKLLESAIPLVLEKPIAGWTSLLDVFASGRLEHMRQGQGIIDIVNSYLGEALVRGIPGLFLFGGALFCSLWAVLRRYHRMSSSGDKSESAVAAFLAAMVIATCFFLVTISMVGHTSTYLWLLVALCSAYSALPIEVGETDASTPSETKRGVNRVRRRSRVNGTRRESVLVPTQDIRIQLVGSEILSK